MSLSVLAVNTLAATAIMLSGQYMKDHLSITFPTFKQEVTGKFGSDKAVTVTSLEETLIRLASEPVLIQLNEINKFFDTNVQYATDQAIFNQSDYWATPGELIGHSRGDCEDHAIAKYVALLHLGIDSTKLRLIYVKAKIGRSRVTQAHMVLGYYETPSSDPLVLDSLVSQISPGSQRPDLMPVFSFNEAGIWQPGKQSKVSQSTSRLSKWRDVIARMEKEGIKKAS